MFFRCGDFEIVMSIFDGLANRDVLVWIGVIRVMVMLGNVVRVIEFFSEMIE